MTELEVLIQNKSVKNCNLQLLTLKVTFSDRKSQAKLGSEKIPIKNGRNVDFKYGIFSSKRNAEKMSGHKNILKYEKNIGGDPGQKYIKSTFLKTRPFVHFFHIFSVFKVDFF